MVSGESLLLLLLSSWMGALASRIGPRVPMTVGPLLCAVGTAGMTLIDADSTYFLDVFAPVTIFGLGLAVTVAPLTATRATAVVSVEIVRFRIMRLSPLPGRKARYFLASP